MLAAAVRLACIAGVCLLLAACGGDSGRLSQERFVARANAVCKRADDRLLTVARPRTFVALAATADQLTAIGNQLYDALRALRPPADTDKKYRSYLRALRAGIDKFVELKAAVVRRDVAAARTVLNLIAANPSGQEATDLRLSQCAKSGVSPRG